MKKKLEIDNLSIFDETLEGASLEDRMFVSRSLEIANQIAAILESKQMLQKDLAAKLDKSEAEISKWLSGFHNFTIKSLVRIEAELGERIITTPQEAIRELANTINKFVTSFINKKINVSNVKPGEKKHTCVVIPFERKAHTKATFSVSSYSTSIPLTGTYNS